MQYGMIVETFALAGGQAHLVRYCRYALAYHGSTSTHGSKHVWVRPALGWISWYWQGQATSCYNCS